MRGRRLTSGCRCVMPIDRPEHDVTSTGRGSPAGSCNRIGSTETPWVSRAAMWGEDQEAWRRTVHIACRAGQDTLLLPRRSAGERPADQARALLEGADEAARGASSRAPAQPAAARLDAAARADGRRDRGASVASDPRPRHPGLPRSVVRRLRTDGARVRERQADRRDRAHARTRRALAPRQRGRPGAARGRAHHESAPRRSSASAGDRAQGGPRLHAPAVDGAVRSHHPVAPRRVPR